MWGIKAPFVKYNRHEFRVWNRACTRGVNSPSLNGDQQNSCLSLHIFPLFVVSVSFIRPVWSSPGALFLFFLLLSTCFSLSLSLSLSFFGPFSAHWHGDPVILGKLRQQCDECTHGASPGVQHGNALVDCCHSSGAELKQGGDTHVDGMCGVAKSVSLTRSEDSKQSQ